MERGDRGRCRGAGKYGKRRPDAGRPGSAHGALWAGVAEHVRMWQPSAAEVAEQMVADALSAQFRRDEAALRRHVAQLAARPAAGWRRITDSALMAYLQRGLIGAWRYGWQPADIARVVRREAGSTHARLAVDAIAAEMRGYPAATVDERWHAQLVSLGARVWWDDGDTFLQARADREGIDRAAVIGCALKVTFVLSILPRLPLLCPLPGTVTRGGEGGADTRQRAMDERVLGRIRALLAKAESTEFPREAEALSARAQEMMARHSVDQALVWAAGAAGSEPEGRRLVVDNPYEAPKAVLLDVVARANRCRAVWHGRLGFSTVFGFASDLAAVELLFTSLLVQATAAMLAAGSRRDADGRSRTRSFRQSFLTAYAERIGERLQFATDRATARVAAESSGNDLLPALVCRDHAVDEAIREAFPQIQERAVSGVGDYEGWICGRTAADLANLNRQPVVAGHGP